MEQKENKMMTNTEYPLITIIIATFNSEKVLPRTLIAIRNQSYPQDKFEIFAVDGGSTDSTFKIAEKYGCRIIENPYTDPMNAKKIGYEKANGTYSIVIDHDEVLENPKSIEEKVTAIIENIDCRVVFYSGYKKPKNYPLLNQYISDFGDPVSCYYYNFPKDYKFLESTLKKNYSVIKETESYYIVSFKNYKKTPLFELDCAGSLVDTTYMKSIIKNYGIEELAHAFYRLIEEDFDKMIFLKSDPIVHYSADSLKKYFPKIKWRICNNVHFSEMKAQGMIGRISTTNSKKWKLYLFPLYSITILIPLLQSIYFSFSRKNIAYMLHPLFCLYATFQIGLQYTIKIFHIPVKLKSYDGKKIIKQNIR